MDILFPYYTASSKYNYSQKNVKLATLYLNSTSCHLQKERSKMQSIKIDVLSLDCKERDQYLKERK